ncbi:hypothetical protein XENOCAPTIV_013918 [Xenoophorus captivus]|uniref:Uncharacterized protein n=1 Tax=Xenoophorus captivus TaxID=1517983 RepID=A0ABV0Q560_9TELE
MKSRECVIIIKAVGCWCGFLSCCLEASHVILDKKEVVPCGGIELHLNRNHPTLSIKAPVDRLVLSFTQTPQDSTPAVLEVLTGVLLMGSNMVPSAQPACSSRRAQPSVCRRELELFI